MIALIDILGKRLLDNAVHLNRDRAPQRRHRFGLFVEDRVQRRLRISPGERRSAGQHFIEDHAERPEIRATIHRPPLSLLGRHIRRRPDGSAVLSEAAEIGDLRQSEVHHLEGSLAGKHQVGALDVTVDDALLVSLLQTAGGLGRQRQRFLERQRSLLNLLLQRRPVNIGHRDEHAAVRFADLKYCGDVRVIERCDRFGLAQETSFLLAGAHKILSDELEGDNTVEVEILRLVDLSHPPLPDLLEDLEVRYGDADHA